MLLQAALAAAFAPALLKWLGAASSTQAGVAAGAVAGTVGAAALAAGGDEGALPAGALAYALVGTLSSVVVGCEPIRAALQALVA